MSIAHPVQPDLQTQPLVILANFLQTDPRVVARGSDRKAAREDPEANAFGESKAPLCLDAGYSVGRKRANGHFFQVLLIGAPMSLGLLVCTQFPNERYKIIDRSTCELKVR